MIAVLSLVLFPLGVLAANQIELYKDGNLTDSSTHFGTGATMYFKVDLDFFPEDEAVVKVKKADGSEVSSHWLNKERAFSGSLVLPNESGSYLVEFVFRAQGSSYQFSRNIQVGDSNSDSTVKILVTNVFSPIPQVSAKPAYQFPGEIQSAGGVQRDTPLPVVSSPATPYLAPTLSSASPKEELEKVMPSPTPEPVVSPAPEFLKERSLFTRVGLVISRFLERIFSFLRAIGLG
jgi:hypothetical protein